MESGDRLNKILRGCLAALLLVCGLALAPDAQAFTLSVVDSDGNAVSGFRWLLEEDTTIHVTPGEQVSDMLAANIHSSYAPVVTNGQTTGSTATISVPTTTRYIVSVMPDSGYAMGGASVALGQDSVTVVVNAYPIPTAQISVWATIDNSPINGFPDPLTEAGIANCTVIVDDTVGQVTQDAFGNPLGTTYATDGSGSFLFNDDGSPTVDMMGTGNIMTNSSGYATIKYLVPNKYGVTVHPPSDGQTWIQTTTIEGTPTNDAWVKADEPPYFAEFGAITPHIIVSFLNPDTLPWALNPPLITNGTISGQIVNAHMVNPTTGTLSYPSYPYPETWVALNDVAGGGLYATPCDEEGNFSIDVPTGSYQLVWFDENLDIVFGFTQVDMPATGGIPDLGQIPAFGWFSHVWMYSFYDANENGFWDADEVPIPEQTTNLRFRDGTIYKAFPTDMVGYVPYDEVFPWFKWLVAEVGYERYKATGVTVVVDAGGAIPNTTEFDPAAAGFWDTPTFGGILNPQEQAGDNPNTGNNLSRTDQVTDDGGNIISSANLLQAIMVYAGQTNVLQWGKTAYADGENGGIAGMAIYDVTRAEDNPRYNAAEEWQPGIPRVQVNLYQDADYDNIIDDLDGDGGPTLADVDNYPFGWQDGTGAIGDEDDDQDGDNIFDPGDAVAIVHTDSWDDNMPTGCIQDVPIIHGEAARECYDNFGTWNQVRPGVFDGGYGFVTYQPGGIVSGSAEERIPAGYYIVEAVPPPGYEVVKEEDKNVDFGDEYTPSTQLLPPTCVGADHTVPAELTLFPGVASIYAGQTLPLCDMKAVTLNEKQNAASDFFFFTEVPKAARAVGIMTNDLAAEATTGNSPIIGEKAPGAFIPVSFQDWMGNEIVRVYSDEFGSYNAMLPSNHTVNVPAPTGVSQQMYDVCLNHPGPIEDPDNPGTYITDPYYNANYGYVCYVLNFKSGTTTYLDTPVLPVGAWVDAPQSADIDLELLDGTPVIKQVSGPGSSGPYVTAAGQVVTITSLGQADIPNPFYDSTVLTTFPTISRDYSFGSIEGTVTIGGVEVDPADVTWATDGASLSFTMPDMADGQYQLELTRGDNLKTTVMGITLHVDFDSSMNPAYVDPGESVQAAIDIAQNGDLIIIRPGQYDENPILWKNVWLQGFGALSTSVNGLVTTSERATSWKDKVQELVDGAFVDLVPGQATTDTFASNAWPTLLVLPSDGDFSGASPGLIDGLTLFGSARGGGVVVNGYARYLEISNNKIYSNLGTGAGGIQVGNPGLTDCTGTWGGPYGCNDHVDIHDNQITHNTGSGFGVGGGAGGVGLYTGSDNYAITDNFIVGNLTSNNGGGVGHVGISFDGTITGNTIALNEVFFGGAGVGGRGGGIYIGSENALTTGLSDGTGGVTIDSNLIQGNLAGASDGGGICALRMNGPDVEVAPDTPSAWYPLNIWNNIIVNNVATTSAGGIFMKDVANGTIINNQVSDNDSSATSADAGAGGFVDTTPQPAGVVAASHSEPLYTASSAAELTRQEFSDATMQNNIIWNNRSYYRDFETETLVLSGVDDLRATGYRVGTTTFSSLTDSILTDATDYPGNSSIDPLFELEYTNTLLSAAAGDEGGNFINITPTPLIINAGDYHLTAASAAAIDQGATNALDDDIDGDARPEGAAYDIGADEYVAPTTAIYTLDIQFSGNGSGYATSDVVGIAEGDNVADYPADTVVTLTATAYNGSVFSGWSGAGCSGTGTCAVTLTADTTVTAEFISRASIGLFRRGAWYLDNGNGTFRAL